MLQTTIETSDDGAVCRVEGDLDPFAASALRDVLSAFCRVPRLLIDLTGTTVRDAASIGVVLAGIRQVRDAGSSVRVQSGHDALVRLLAAAGVPVVAGRPGGDPVPATGAAG